ncbi:MAG TPA: heme-binding protein [Vicinamibacterales bacterium]|jgi:glc operon protein GlcG|nr:heme-binding protein [Vicinamibacterales bacterium]
MRSKPVLTADHARQIVSAARLEAENQGRNVSIAVVDDGGYLVAFERLDGAFPHSAELAIAKARTAAIMRRPTKALEEMVKDRPGLLTMPGLTRVQGGLPILVDGECVGAVGVSGVTSEQDEQVAAAGIAASS